MSPRAVDKRARPGNEGAPLFTGEISLPLEPGRVEEPENLEEVGGSADLAAVGAVKEQASPTDEVAGSAEEKSS